MVVATRVASGRFDTSATTLACYSGRGFSDGLEREAQAGGIALVGLDQLYGRRDT